ncbi:DDE_3 domain-containing protein [Trichonephila clavipes]|nr:DDE_3 domain-containing protein [Trichonephila clavipes]
MLTVLYIVERTYRESLLLLDKDRESCRLSDHNCGQLHPYTAPVFPIGNGIFQQDSVRCQKARILLEEFEEHKDEFKLISYSLNQRTLLLTLIGHIWILIEKQLGDQIPSCPNISSRLFAITA